jgi:hypothetical protein
VGRKKQPSKLRLLGAFPGDEGVGSRSYVKTLHCGISIQFMSQMGFPYALLTRVFYCLENSACHTV